MSEREQLKSLCRWNRELANENSRLREDVSRLSGEHGELTRAKVNLQAQLEAADAFLGAAMDDALGVRQP